MPDLIYGTTISDGDVITVSGVNDRLFDASSPDTSLAIVNGGLDENNLDGYPSTSPYVQIGPDHVQPGSLVDNWRAAGTANLDYIWQHFGLTDIADEDVGAPGDSPVTATTWNTYAAKPIPGGCRSFWLNWDARVVIAWNIMWTNDNSVAEGTARHLTRIFLRVDSSYQTSCRRSVGQTTASSTHEGYARNGVYCGHAVVDMTRGYHDVALEILQDKQVQQARVWARSIHIMPLKYTAP